MYILFDVLSPKTTYPFRKPKVEISENETRINKTIQLRVPAFLNHSIKKTLVHTILRQSSPLCAYGALFHHVVTLKEERKVKTFCPLQQGQSLRQSVENV